MRKFEYGTWTVDNSECDTLSRVVDGRIAATVPAPSRCAERVRAVKAWRAELVRWWGPTPDYTAKNVQAAERAAALCSCEGCR